MGWVSEQRYVSNRLDSQPPEIPGEKTTNPPVWDGNNKHW